MNTVETNKKFRLFIFLMGVICVSFLLTSCSTHRPIPVADLPAVEKSIQLSNPFLCSYTGKAGVVYSESTSKTKFSMLMHITKKCDSSFNIALLGSFGMVVGSIQIVKGELKSYNSEYDNNKNQTLLNIKNFFNNYQKILNIPVHDINKRAFNYKQNDTIIVMTDKHAKSDIKEVEVNVYNSLVNKYVTSDGKTIVYTYKSGEDSKSNSEIISMEITSKTEHIIVKFLGGKWAESDPKDDE